MLFLVALVVLALFVDVRISVGLVVLTVIGWALTKRERMA